MTASTTKHEVNGIRIACDDRGSGGPPLLFVHGFGGDKSDWRALMDTFAPERRVVAIDAPGHGESDPSPFGYAIETRAKGIGKVVQALGLDRPVLVVHSLGVLGFEAVRQNPGMFSALVCVDAALFVPPEVRGAFEGLLGGLRSEHWKAALRGMIEQVGFIATDPEGDKQAVIARMLALPQQVLIETWAAFLAYDATAAIASCPIPVLQIEGTMPYDRAQLLATNPRIEIGRVVGSGHFPQRVVPDQVAAMIRRFTALHA